MKKILWMVMVVLAVYSPELSFGQDIEIKGLSLGMSKEKFDKDIGTNSMKNFTIAGVKSMYSLRPEFFENNLDAFNFFFDAGKFDDVLSAVTSKYSDIKCEESELSNAMGAHFKQVECELKGNVGTLRIVRFVGDVNTSLLSLWSDRYLKDFTAKRKEKQKDI
ncbi:MAG: hypothetical protein Q7U88_07055 [Desulfocapsaceae bacterium]|nr:hypothetical protein [Desulfocapsaceae bacterium]